MYTFEEAFTASLHYFNGDELAADVFLKKYALRDNDNNLVEKTPEDMHWRIAKELAKVEKIKFDYPLSKEEIFSYLDRFKYIIPQGSPMYGIGNYYKYVTLSNCYVLPSPLDSYSSIIYTDQELAQISKRRGGTGLDISNLRPAGSTTKNASQTSTGIISFMRRFSNTIREVGQNGRRGALMITISVHHPQILDFIKVKQDLKEITGANISIRISDEFLLARTQNTDYELRFPVNSKNVVKRISAAYVWDELIKSAHTMAEPGILFWDNIIRESPADCYRDYGFETIATNPCSEIPLSAYDSCRLLCLNLYSYVKNPFTTSSEFDYRLFDKHAQLAQRLLDDIIDIEIKCINRIIKKIKNDPEPMYVKKVELDLWKKIKQAAIDGRRTGTGITGMGDCLAALNIKYGSDTSISVAENIYKQLKLSCYRASVDMAKEVGSFPLYNAELEKDNPFIQRIKNEDPKLYKDMLKYGRRNIALLTTAPTGSVSIMTQTTSGIEPLFQPSYTRRKKINPNERHIKVDFIDQNGDAWQEFKVYHSKLKKCMEIIDTDNENNTPYFKACAEYLDWKQRVKLQATVQKHIDHAISSTLNLPEDVTVEKVKEIYETAYQLGCKGITVYRKNSRTGVLIDTENKARGNKIVKNYAPVRIKEMQCKVHKLKRKGIMHYVLVGLLNNEPYETFLLKAYNKLSCLDTCSDGKLVKVKRGHYRFVANNKNNDVIENITDYCSNVDEVITRLVSTNLRHGVDISFIVHQLEKAEGDIESLGKCLARVLKTYIKDGAEVSGEECTECSGKLIRSEGCVKCQNCGWSKC